MANLEAFKAHIRAFTFYIGFNVIREGGGSTTAPGLRLQCIHHSVKTQNNRKLEDRVTRDNKGGIVSRRKLNNTNVK
jgi:hypothetical protein